MLVVAEGPRRCDYTLPQLSLHVLLQHLQRHRSVRQDPVVELADVEAKDRIEKKVASAKSKSGEKKETPAKSSDPAK